ncbi:hypothetical protein CGLO_18090 [Colletotrichum gloeosporioides Cg-14]|uniref:Major facilitator superfamily (MFS) profile domain-containing protein n=1 Tax=Colletotrichum gloeosporioides (strain Cg-14) TaxID=1237896 RepID=T0JV54_COLGC|nr:hypothetical protein CGLO_18090 [Colletotrichum gloeosporioides Cg-14]
MDRDRLHATHNVHLALGLGLRCIQFNWVYILNTLMFGAGSALCGAAPNIETLIIGRVIAGVGGSGMYSGTLTYVSILSNDQDKPAYLAGSTVIWGVGSVLGPVVGGVFAASSATWRWVCCFRHFPTVTNSTEGFYINLPIDAAFAPAYFLLFLSVDPHPTKNFAEKLQLRLIDWISAVIFLAGCECLTIVLTFGGVIYSFQSGTVAVLWAVTGILLFAFIVALKLHPLVDKENRLYPIHFFKQPILINMQLQVFLSSGVILAMTYYIPLYFQFIKGDGALLAGVRLLPLIIFMVAASMVNGFPMPRYGLIPIWYIGGSSLALIGAALTYTVDDSTANANIYGYSILVGTGAECYIVAGFAIVQSLVPAYDIANAVGAMTISQDLGMVLFLAISGSLFHNMAVNNVGNALPDVSHDKIGNLIAGTSSTLFQALSDEEKNIVISQIVNAMESVLGHLLSSLCLQPCVLFPISGNQIRWYKV